MNEKTLYVKQKQREEGLKDFNKHDFILLTDNEEFV